MTFVSIGFIAWILILIVRAEQIERSNNKFTRWTVYGNSVAYTFLLCFLLMAGANIALFFGIKAHNQLRGKPTYSFRREQCTLTLVLFFFEIGYAFRFVWDKYLEVILFEQYDFFTYYFVADLVAISEGISLLILMIFHRRNFK